ncbi:MAG: hypothetical protein K2P37_12300 [Oscillospiraceae bacterium]|nr:hypothetical protein [Oscillospiraceae bacterium]
MYCVIQEVRRKKPDPYGEHKEIIPDLLEMSINGVEQVPIWQWRWSEERFERPRLESYKITLHQSFREGGAVRKRQYAVCTMSYYGICENWWGDCIVGGENALAKKVGMDAAELYEIIEAKLGPLRERLEADFHQSAEYQAKQEHQRILDAHRKARSAFSKRYGVDGDEYDRCYDVFGVLQNKEYLAKIKADRKARKQEEQARWSSYRESWQSTHEQYTSSGYSVPVRSTYTEEETAILKQFYRSLSKTYHPDLNPGADTTAAMQLLNKLKETWGV